MARYLPGGFQTSYNSGAVAPAQDARPPVAIEATAQHGSRQQYSAGRQGGEGCGAVSGRHRQRLIGGERLHQATRPLPNGCGAESVAADRPPPSFTDELLEALPYLRRSAQLLTRNRHDADDLVQDCIVRVLAASDSFRPGTDFRAWAFTVLRNRFLTTVAARNRGLMYLGDVDKCSAHAKPTQMQGLEARDLLKQFALLPCSMQRLLKQVAGAQVPYATLAKDSGCAVNTVKTRVHRARAAMQKRLEIS